MAVAMPTTTHAAGSAIQMLLRRLSGPGGCADCDSETLGVVGRNDTRLLLRCPVCGEYYAYHVATESLEWVSEDEFFVETL